MRNEILFTLSKFYLYCLDPFVTWVCLKIPKCVKTSAECRINSTEIVQVHATIDQKETARQLIHDYPINSTDAYILQCVLDKANQLRTSGDDLILVSFDKGLLNAARSERLLTFNPETDSQTSLDVFINSP